MYLKEICGCGFCLMEWTAVKTQRRHIVFRIIRTDRDTVQKAKRLWTPQILLGGSRLRKLCSCIWATFPGKERMSQRVQASLQDGPQHSPSFWYSYPWVAPSHTEEDWPVGTVYIVECSVWLLRVSHERHCSLHLAFLNHLLWGKTAAVSWGHSSSPTEMLTWWGTEVSCPQSRGWSWKWIL